MNDAAIEEIYNRNIDMLYKICYQYFNGNTSMIDDPIQNIFYKLIKKKIKFKDLNHEKAWMITAIKNECLNILKNKSNKNVELDFDIVDSKKEDNTLELVLKLPTIYKLPMYLFYYEDYSAKEIAEILNETENTVYSQLNRGRKLLKIEMEKD